MGVLMRAANGKSALLLKATPSLFRRFYGRNQESDFNPLGLAGHPYKFRSQKNEEKLQKALESLKDLKGSFEHTAWHLPKPDPKRNDIMEMYYGHPFTVEGSVLPFEMKENDDAVFARIGMPGVNRRGVRVWMEEDHHLHFEGEEGPKDPKSVDLEDWQPRKFACRIYLPPGCYNTDYIKANVQNGVLRIVVSKVKNV